MGQPRGHRRTDTEHACFSAQADEEFIQQPGGYAIGVISRGGTNVSGTEAAPVHPARS